MMRSTSNVNFVSGIGESPNTIITAGDSLAANGHLVTPAVNPTFKSLATEGAFNWFNALLGQPFNYVGNTAVGGKTIAQMITEQFPTILAARPKYVWITCGHNDIYNELVTAAVAAGRMQSAITQLLSAGITPIWTTIWARSFDVARTTVHIQYNDIMRQWAKSNLCGLFYDGFEITNDPSDSNCQGRLPLASFYYDSTIHPNNLLAYRIGQYAAQKIGGFIQRPNTFVIGAQDTTLTGGTSNILANPSFSGSVAVVSTGGAGVMPTTWTLDWATRTGSGVATGAIVDVTDSTTGFVIAKAIQVTISGVPAANDIMRITQNTGLNTQLTSGNVTECEGIVQLASSAAVSEIAIRTLVNSTDGNWCLLNGQTAVTLPASIGPLSYRSQQFTVGGSGTASAAQYDVRLRFNGNGAGTVLTFYRPRWRKVS